LARADGRAGGLQSPAGTGFKPRAGRNYWKKWKREKMPDSVRKAIQRCWFTDEQMWRKEHNEE